MPRRIRGRVWSARGVRVPRVRFRAVKKKAFAYGAFGDEGEGGGRYLAGYDGKLGCEKGRMG
jgi:hypothetical protein